MRIAPRFPADELQRPPDIPLIGYFTSEIAMQNVLLTPRIVINSIFILGFVLMIAYTIELAQCKLSKRKSKRIYGVLICAWFLFLGAYVLFALANATGIIVMLIGVFVFRWEKRMTDKLFLLLLLTLCLHVSALN